MQVNQVVCEGRTIYGKRCRMTVHKAGMKHCRFHSGDPALRAKAVAENVAWIKAYWEHRRAAEQLAATADVASTA
jgi:hypothetical protein